VYLITAYCEAGYLQVILTGIVQSSQDLLHKEAHMFLLGHINTLLKPFTADIQLYLQQSGLPELTNAVGLMRFRALWLISKLARLPLDSALKTLIVQRVCTALQDAELPVRVQAAVSLSKLEWKEATNIVKTYIKDVLQAFITLMSQFDCEELADALAELIESQLDYLKDYAGELVAMLSSYFFKLVAVDPGDDEGEAAMTALAVLSSLGKLLDCAAEDAELFSQLLSMYLPVMEFCLKDNSYLAEGLELLNVLIDYAPPGHDFFPSYLLSIGRAICGDNTTEPYAFSCIYAVVGPIESLLQKYGCSRLDLATLVAIVRKLVEEDDREARKAAAEVIESIKQTQDAPQALLAELGRVSIPEDESSEDEMKAGGMNDDPEYLSLLAKIKSGSKLY
jgi:hypothetical protein